MKTYFPTLCAGLMLGAAIGLMVGLSRSPVVGAVIAGLIGILSAAIPTLTRSGQSTRPSTLEWYTTSLAGALIIGLSVGLYLRTYDVSPADQYVKILRGLNASPETIINMLGSAAEKSSDPKEYFGAQSVEVYAGPVITPIKTPNRSESGPSAEDCNLARPPAAGYQDLDGALKTFNDRGGKLKNVATLVSQTTLPDGSSNLTAIKGALLKLGYAALCE